LLEGVKGSVSIACGYRAALEVRRQWALKTAASYCYPRLKSTGIAERELVRAETGGAATSR